MSIYDPPPLDVVSYDRHMTQKRMTQRDRGFRDALQLVADTIHADAGWKSRDEALLALEERLEKEGIVREWVAGRVY